MFQRMKSLFKKENPESNEKFDHSRLSSQDISECPFMSKQTTKKSECPQPLKEKKDKKVKNQSDSQEEAPKGGCPFMKTSDKKRNPPLPINHSGYDEPFISKFKYYLSSNKLDFSHIMNGQNKTIIKREKFNTYPIYLQHTLFFQGEDFKKIRKLECCSRFLAYEELRQKGNKYFLKGQFQRSLDYYERAFSLFRWLEYEQIKKFETQLSIEKIQSEQSIDYPSENDKSKISLNLNSDKEIKKPNISERTKEYEDMQQKYKEFFIIYHDGNVKLHDGQECQEDADLDMRKSLLLQIYLNMSAAYIHLNNYTLALQVIEEAINLSNNVSQAFFRKAQALILNKGCSLQQAYQANKAIKKAISMKPHEKIFASSNTNILRMLNLHDAEEAYSKCNQIVQETIIQLQRKKESIQKRIHDRAQQIHKVEMRIISEGKVPTERLDRQAMEQTSQYKIIQRIKQKYIKVIEFYTEGKNPEQVTLAKKEFQQVLRVISEINLIYNCEIKEENQELGGITTEKVSKRIKNVRTEIANEVYNQGKFNFTVLQWAIKEIVQEQSKIREANQTQSTQQEKSPIFSKKSYVNFSILIVLIPILLILFNSYLI